MQILLLLQSEKELVIPFNYNHQLQSAIYAKLREGGGEAFHDSGFGEEHVFKAFVFGALKGAHSKEDSRFRFTGAETNPTIRLFDTRLTVIDASLANVHITGGRQLFQTSSPVAVYRREPDGKTTFFAPGDPEFAACLLSNYENKYRAVTGSEPEPLTIEPLDPQRKIVTRFKETWINGYKGNYALTGSPRALEFVYNAGLGVKNSAGFGMLERL